MKRMQIAALWEMTRSGSDTERREALLKLAGALRNRPRSTLSADELAAVRAWEASYRQKRREAIGGRLREEHRDYCREWIANEGCQQKRKEYQKAHKQEARDNLARWRGENRDRVELYVARQRARRHGEEPPSLGEGFATRGSREQEVQSAAGAVDALAAFLADGMKRRDECMAHIGITDSEAWDAFLEKATAALPMLWEDDDGSLGFG